ncbi:MAG TPA: hypothetical protein VFD65_00025 [Chitinophagales bacterium]|nr:hypothetical protein [Chitinophagales bacterium]
MQKSLSLFITLLISITIVRAAYTVIPMDDSQTNHLKAYGIAYWALEQGVNVDWLLNYKGGSFAIPSKSEIEKECIIRGVKFETLPDASMLNVLDHISQPEVNMDAVRLEKAPKIAVYSPDSKLPWDDAVTLVLTYAEIPYTLIYDTEILEDELVLYDWLHLHHEDFTGQYGKFYAAYRNASWYIQQQKDAEALAQKHGFSKVSDAKLAVAQKIKEYVVGGGFMFAMCSATDTYDIALSAENTDICHQIFDGDPMDPQAQEKLDFSKTFAFENFKINKNLYEYEVSDIDVPPVRPMDEKMDYFSLFEFSAKWDPVPTMLTQNHSKLVKGFMGQTTAFKKRVIKKDVLILGDNKLADEAKYIHGEMGKGTWTFYGGHDPEAYRHLVGDPPTDLNLHPNSPGYRLILNNILFPAAKKKERKT